MRTAFVCPLILLTGLVTEFCCGETTTSDIPESVAEVLTGLPVLEQPVSVRTKNDFLIDASFAKAKVYRSRDGQEFMLDNGLIRRTWRVTPNGACVGFDNLTTGQAILRGVRPEAILSVNGKEVTVGGLSEQPNHAFLTPEWLKNLSAREGSLRLSGITIGKPQERFTWKRVRHHASGAQWPPPGLHVTMTYVPAKGENNAPPINVEIHYEMYDGIPAISKWVSVTNNSESKITIDRFTAEQLALVEHTNWVEARDGVDVPRSQSLHVETDFAFGGFGHENANRHVVHYEPDAAYATQVNYLRKTPCLLEVRPTYGPAQDVAPGKTFDTFRVFELAYDSFDRERRSLTLKKLYRTVAPWVTENPITHHLINSDPETVKKAIQNAKAVGFETVIMSFGSGFQMESRDSEYLRTWKEVADFAEQQNIELGSYSLFSSRRIGDGNDIVPPEGMKLTHGNCPAATSEWGRKYYQTLTDFYDTTGFDQFENDGPYPGDVDVTPRPPFQKGVDDSRWAQWKIVTDLYQHLRGLGVYINAPDYYYLSGSNKCGMGYRETNWSLPRAQQIIHTRQNIYDGTWTKTPSMGWMFVPLSTYHGGGDAAKIEPLHDHRDHYDRLMKCNLGMGVQAHYRGPRLFDTDETKAMVRQNVDWFKEYRGILESDFVHGRRADGRDVDWILHVNPELEEKGMLCVYNPLPVDVEQELDVNLYYTGIQEDAKVSQSDKSPKSMTLSREYRIKLPIQVPAMGMSWYVIRDGK